MALSSVAAVTLPNMSHLWDGSYCIPSALDIINGTMVVIHRTTIVQIDLLHYLIWKEVGFIGAPELELSSRLCLCSMK